MAGYINRYGTLTAYTAEASARDNLGLTVSLVTADGKVYYDGKLNKLGLPPFTIRVKYKSGKTPSKGDSQRLVDATENVWDITKNNVNWSILFQGDLSLIAVFGANSNGVTDMSYMFRGCTSLTSVDLFDTSSVTDMSYMFSYCTSLTSVPLFNTSSVTDMNQMLLSCIALTSVPLFDTSRVTNMSNMLRGCSSLTSVPLFNTSSVTDMKQMLLGCIALTSVPLFDTSRVTNMSNMFENCTSVESGALTLYQQASTQTNPPANHTDTFKLCGRDTVTGAAELAQIHSSWGGTMA